MMFTLVLMMTTAQLRKPGDSCVSILTQSMVPRDFIGNCPSDFLHTLGTWGCDQLKRRDPRIHFRGLSGCWSINEEYQTLVGGFQKKPEPREVSLAEGASATAEEIFEAAIQQHFLKQNILDIHSCAEISFSGDVSKAVSPK